MNNKRILVISSIFPGYGTPTSFTPVVHFFVREWVKLGYDVRVIHTCSFFPRVYYRAPAWVRRYLQNRIGIALPEIRLDKEIVYEYEGVRVYRIPMRKLLPMGSFSTRELRKACLKAAEFINENGFTPHYIISHWLNPQLVLMSYLKHITNAITTMVLHGAQNNMDRPFKCWDELCNDVDIWGYRAEKTKELFETLYGTPKFSFRCMSGIPDYYTQNIPIRDGSFHNSFVQVGLLIERKHPDKVIEAIHSLYNNDYSLNIIGDGLMYDELSVLIERLGISANVHLLGRLPRTEVISILDASDVFVLISSNEVFGLAYIEAMARGCIVIASRGEGMEGIIRDGENGFFCEAGNTDELAVIIDNIRHLSNSARKRISDAAIQTSRELTDTAVARKYIDTVVNYGEMIHEQLLSDS